MVLIVIKCDPCERWIYCFIFLILLKKNENVQSVHTPNEERIKTKKKCLIETPKVSIINIYNYSETNTELNDTTQGYTCCIFFFFLRNDSNYMDSIICGSTISFNLITMTQLLFSTENKNGISQLINHWCSS